MRQPWRRLAVHVSHNRPDYLTDRGDMAGARCVHPLSQHRRPSHLDRSGWSVQAGRMHLGLQVRREHRPQPLGGVIHEGPDLRRGAPPPGVHELHGQRRRFEAGKHDGEVARPQLFGDLTVRADARGRTSPHSARLTIINPRTGAPFCHAARASSRSAATHRSERFMVDVLKWVNAEASRCSGPVVPAVSHSDTAQDHGYPAPR